MANSSKADIALSKTKVTGVVFVGDKTSKLPTDGTSALDSTFVNVGYISDDGIENDTDIKTKDVTEMGAAPSSPSSAATARPTGSRCTRLMPPLWRSDTARVTSKRARMARSPSTTPCRTVNPCRWSLKFP